MISRAEVDKLLKLRAAGPSLLSLYVQVPLDPAELRGLPAHVGELFALAARDVPGIAPGVRVGTAEAQAVRGLLASRARDWLGHTVAVFACAGLGLAEAIPLPCRLQERAMLAARPHVRPLLLAIQRCPAYRVAVVDRRHAWLFSIADGQISTAVLPPAEGMRSHGFSGWYGLQAHRVNERIIQLARHHYRDTAALLDRAARASGAEPLVIGGHQDTVPQFLDVLPAGLRDQFAGSFVADPHTLTPAKVRDLAGRLIQDWRNLQDQRIAAEFLGEPPDGRAVTGLSACLAAAGRHASSTPCLDRCDYGTPATSVPLRSRPDLRGGPGDRRRSSGGQARLPVSRCPRPCPDSRAAAAAHHAHSPRRAARVTVLGKRPDGMSQTATARVSPWRAAYPEPQARTTVWCRPEVTKVPSGIGPAARTLGVARLPPCRRTVRPYGTPGPGGRSRLG